MKIEINIPNNIMDDMVKEQEVVYSSCFVLENKIDDIISQEFLKEILTEYKINKSSNYLNIKISKNND